MPNQLQTDMVFHILHDGNTALNIKRFEHKSVLKFEKQIFASSDIFLKAMFPLH